MYLKQLTISNYKSFYEPKKFDFEPGFNVLLGANSSGKTSVLEAIYFHELANTPHRSIINITEVDKVLAEGPEVQLRFSTGLKEVCNLIQPATELFLSLQSPEGHVFAQDINSVMGRLGDKSLCLDFMNRPATGQFFKINFEHWDAMWRNLHNPSQIFALAVRSSDAEPLQVANFSGGAGDGSQLWSRVPHKIYKFSAERAVQPAYGHHATGDLLPNSVNLAYCINHLQSHNKNLFEILNALMHRIFPTIHWISAPPTGNTTFELKIHTTPSSMNRGDLAVPINRVGTGVGNALAMLYVALTAQTQRFILLEEPNSFLHPRALRELLAILAEIGGKHQFFITTHSSDVLRTVKASTVTLLTHDGKETSVQQTAGSNLHELRSGLIDVGIRLTDLHGCDSVLWVEGSTEEAVFPLLLRKFFPEKAEGMAVLPVVTTGDFSSKKVKPKKIAEIYERLSKSSFLAPPMVAISLDREGRSKEEIEQLEKDTHHLVRFLPQTMLENYFLEPEAIAHVLSERSDKVLDSKSVQTALDEAVADKANSLQPQSPKGSPAHAAKVLNAVFRKLAESEYNKISDGVSLAEWLIENKPDHFNVLKDWFAQFIHGAARA
jgi:predicted ATPase